MIVKVTLDTEQKPTEAQLEEIRKASGMPVVYDEDSPELTEAMKMAFIEAADKRNTSACEA